MKIVPRTVESRIYIIRAVVSNKRSQVEIYSGAAFTVAATLPQKSSPP